MRDGGDLTLLPDPFCLEPSKFSFEGSIRGPSKVALIATISNFVSRVALHHISHAPSTVVHPPTHKRLHLHAGHREDVLWVTHVTCRKATLLT